MSLDHPNPPDPDPAAPDLAHPADAGDQVDDDLLEVVERSGDGAGDGQLAGGDGREGRWRVQVGTAPATIRILRTTVDAGMIPDTYVTDGTPVVIEAVSGASTPTAGDQDAPLPLAVTPLRPALLASLLAEHLEVVRVELDDRSTTRDVEATPPVHVLSAVLARRSWPGLPPLRGMIGAPVLRPDGTLLQRPGYDPGTGLYLASTVDLEPVPDHPTPGQVQAAREFFGARFLRDFPWVSPADRANYLALLATPILRPFTRCLSPFAVVDATMPASGKTILTSCMGMLSGQRVLTWTDNDTELRKSITAVLADPAGVIVWDNLPEGAVIDSPVLARLVTERVWTDRLLGTNDAGSWPNDRMWLATGNNLRTGGDMASRTVWVRLDPDMPHPEARTGFSIPNLDSWILDPAHQATVLRHLLTLVLDWTAAGARPSTTVPAMRQFTRWAQHLGGLLDHHRIPGFLANAADGRALDDDAGEWRAFLLRWHDQHHTRALTAHQLRRTAEPDHGRTDPWNGTFPTTSTGQLPSVKSLGRRLTGQTGRWRGDIVLRSVTDQVTNARAYWVEHPPTPMPLDPVTAEGSESNPETRKPGHTPADQPKRGP